jgi:LCP family protein required for cell wall assembly
MTTLPPVVSTTTTTSPPPETTTTEALATYDITGPMADGINEAIASVYAWLAGNSEVEVEAPPGLIDHLADVAPPVETTLEATGAVGELPSGDRVAVAFVNDDTWFLVRDGGPWRIVGADTADAPPWLGDEPRTLLVIGSDARVGENQLRFRADSIHVVTVAPAEAAGAIVGFPRDSWIDHDEVLAGNETAGLPESELPPGGTKWTNLLASRGPEIMLGTAEVVTGIDLEGYVITGFKGFDGLITFLGGLVIELPTTMRSGNTWSNFPAGLQTLNPTRALQLARIRKGLPRGDFDRSFNQGLIMQAAMAMVQELGIEATPALLTVLLENAWTDLETEALFTWALSAFIMEPDALTNIVMAGSTGTVGAASVVFLDDDFVAATSADLADDGLLNESAG